MQDSCQYSDSCERSQRDESRPPPPYLSEEQEGHHHEGPLRKRARLGRYAGPSTTSRHTGHVVDGNIARDYARVQYGDVHNVYHGTTSTAVPAPSSPDELLNSLSFVQMDVRQENIAKAHSATCQWLFDRPEYKAWRDPNHRTDHHGFFWIKSKPGAGKSTLMKFLLNSAKQRLQQDNIISFFFNARGGQLEQTIEGMYRHLLHQLLRTIPRLQNVLKLPNAYDAFQHGWPVEKLKSLFQEAILSLGKIRLTCFIDALDECPENQVRDMIDFLQDLGHSSNSGAIDIHVCFASRHYLNVDIAKCQHFTLDGQEEHERDIASYVKQRLHGRSKKIETIRDAIREKAHGVFLWAALVVQILNREIDHGKVHNIERLEEIPPGLHELFQDILSRDSEDDEYLLPILRWIMYAKRPLSREELYFAIHSGAPNSIALEPWDDEEIDLKSMDLFILNCSKGLAELTCGDNPTVQFIHESVRDYLRDTGLKTLQSSPSGTSHGSSQNYLKQCCWNLISQKVLEDLNLPTPLPKAKSSKAKQLRKRASRLFPFLEYACSYMTHHAELASSHGIDHADFFASFPVSTWVSIHDMFAIHGTRRLGDSMATVCNILAQQKTWRLLELSMRSRKSPLNPDQIEAAFRASLNSDDVDSLMPLFDGNLKDAISTSDQLKTNQLAMKTQSLAALRVVLKRDSRTLFDKNCGAILERASHLGNPDILGCLVDHGLDVSSVHELQKRAPLESAVNGGHEAFVTLLLQHLRKTNFSTLVGASYQALNKGRLSIARIISRDAHSKGMGERLETEVLGNALRLASREGNPRLLQLVLQLGVHPSVGLGQASGVGHEASVRLLLGRGADVNYVPVTGRSAVHQASRAGHEVIVRLLLEQGVHVNRVRSIGRTALHEASEAGHEAVVRLLLENSADVNCVCAAGRSALDEASEAGHEAVVRVLLEHGANSNYVSTGLESDYRYT